MEFLLVLISILICTNITDICTFAPEQTYLPINHARGTECVLSPQCENKCQERGLLSAGSQCVGRLVSSK
ncbi:hypothetical protein MKX03_028495 [Papaver bracteatum]|nr:hypothetical protein MKX03_028495 [Papaver bracteatum]